MKTKIKLIKITKLKKGPKKYEAEFKKNNKIIKRKFGAKGMSDFTIHKDTERRDRYIKRHKKDLKTNDPTRAGYLSMYILWNKKTFKASVADYKRRLNSYNRTGKFKKKITGSVLKFGVKSLKDLATEKILENIPLTDIIDANYPSEITSYIRMYPTNAVYSWNRYKEIKDELSDRAKKYILEYLRDTVDSQLDNTHEDGMFWLEDTTENSRRIINEIFDELEAEAYFDDLDLN